MDCLGALGHNLYNKLCCGVYEAENGHGIRFHNVEPRSVVFGTIKNSPGWHELDQKRPCVVCMKSVEMNG